MIVRRGFPRSLVYVREDAKPELRIFVENFALGRVVAKVGSDKCLVPQYLFDKRANSLSTFSSGLRLENLAARRGKPLQCVRHNRTSHANFTLRSKLPPSFVPCQ